MNIFRSNVGTLNEILFENKNKLYGAYAIRSAYGSTVFKSLGITASFILGGAWLLSLLVNTEMKETEIPITGPVTPPSITTHSFDVTPAKPEKTAVVEPKGGAAVKNNTTQNVVIKNDAPLDSVKVAVNDQANNTNTNTNTNDNGNDLTNNNNHTTSTGTGSLTATDNSTHNMTDVDDAPAFPGSIQNFWASHLRYPNEARENNVEGRLVVNFVLDESGKVTNASIVKKLGFGCDDEVLRVIKLMPSWKPAKVAGKGVKVTFNQVVDFKLK